ncbi:MAG: InlB B-repeat-containing protein [Treponema sp.]|jgi:uncharacterized repeat protein (TIGR02543 family)|nr:InlB B-repeat-containing protein [Treponema sp.]
MKVKSIFLALAVITILFVSCGNIWWPQKDNYTVTFHANGGTGTAPTAQSVVARSSITLPHGNGLTKTGYTFGGWNKKHTGDGDHHYAGSSFTPTGHITLYARWVNNETGNPDSPSSNPVNGDTNNDNYSGNNSGNNTNTPTRKSPTFLPDPVLKQPGNPLAAELEVTYDGNGYDGGSLPVDTKKYRVGAQVTVLDAEDLVKHPISARARATDDDDGYVFAQWSTHQEYDKDGVSISSGETFNITDHTTLYAVWLEKSRVIELLDGDDENISSRKFTFAEKNYGYLASELKKETMTIFNTKTEPTGPLIVTISGHADAFTISGLSASMSSIVANGHINFSIIPKVGLDAGYYSVKVKIANNTDFSAASVRTCFIVGFVVKPLPLTLSIVPGSVTYSNEQGDYVTPIVSDSTDKPAYTEADAYFKVEVSGFLKAADVNGVELCLFDSVGKMEAFMPSFCNPTPGGYINDEGKGKQVYSAAATYNGQSETQFASGIAPIGVALSRVPSNYYFELDVTNEVEVNIHDGFDTADNRVVYVYDDLNPGDDVRARAFNFYAGTPGGLLRHYEQTENIVLKAPSAGGSNWTAIGTGDGAASFTGSYDGGEFTVTGITVNSSNDNQGMFGYIGAGSKVRNLGLVSVNITGKSFVGGMVGYNNGGTVESCYVTSGTVTGTVGDCGGIVGNNESGSLVRLCYVTGPATITAAVNNAGGVAGRNYLGTVERCYTADIIVTAPNDGSNSGRQAGGIVGWNDGPVQNCYTLRGQVIGATYVGGIVGRNSAQYGASNIQYCYSTSTVIGTGKFINDTPYSDFVGGVLGQNFRGGRVQNNVALNPSVTGDKLRYVGRVVGKNSEHNTNTLNSPGSNAGTTPTSIYARSMTITNDGTANAIDVIHGTEIDSGKWSDPSWWQNSANWTGGAWNGTSIWDFSSISATSLPRLLDMPNGPNGEDGLDVQDPQVP